MVDQLQTTIATVQHTTPTTPSSTLEAFNEFVSIVSRLRKDCPWDREQTHESLRPALIEEAYETIEAIDSRDYTELKKELGDLLLHIVFHSVLGTESGSFTLEEVIRTESEKLVYRHPHVFGATQVSGSEEVKTNWEQLKRRETGRNSVLDGVPESLPALQRSTRIQEKASKVGFDWQDTSSVWKKVREEIEEFETESDPARREEEFGDLLFSLVNVSRHEKIDAETALRHATKKFERRFRQVEKSVEGSGRPMQEFTLEELDAIWDEVKKNERNV
jgi:MazG family protein